MRGLTALALMISVASVGPAWAAADCSALLNQGCDCAVAFTPGESVGELMKYGVGVQKTAAGGYSPANATTQLHINEQFAVGSDGATFITAGPACQSRQLPAKSRVSVSAIDACACVKIERNESAGASGDNGGALVLGAAVIGGGGIAAAVLLNNKKTSVSP